MDAARARMEMRWTMLSDWSILVDTRDGLMGSRCDGEGRVEDAGEGSGLCSWYVVGFALDNSAER